MSSSANDILSLPTSLILLVHLHILEYPHANNPEYDHEIFNPRTRGLRERAKTMEDIAYFLIGKIEKKSAKAILSTYPCIQPSESLAFRTSLTKYLENLRHQCIYPSSSAARTTGKQSTSSLKVSDSKPNSESVAWWWKDVVVRKSLLEECSGDKFERLMLSLSTHALMKASRPIQPDKMSTLLRTQPVLYTSALARYQASRHAWAKAAALLLRSDGDLQILRESLNDITPTKFASLSTERLQALAESKLQILLQQHWTGEAGRKVFFSLVELAGIRLSSSSSLSSSSISLSAEQIELDKSSKPTGHPSPLPIAAAHHPAHLKRLRKPIFQPKFKSNSTDLATPAPDIFQPPSSALPLPPRVRAQSHAAIILAADIDAEKHMRQTLGEALAQAKQVGEGLSAKVKRLSAARPRQNLAGPSSTIFWTPATPAFSTIDFDPKPDMALMRSLGLEREFMSLGLNADAGDGGEDEDALEKKIHDIRFSKLPPYPAVPDPMEPRMPPLELEKKAEVKARIPVLQSKPSSSSSTNQSSNHKPLPPTQRQHPTLPTEPQQPPIHPPSTPQLLLSPGKESRSIRRKSVRFSMAQRRSGRPRSSMFGLFGTGEVEDEVDRLINETHDFPTDDEGSDTDTEANANSDQFLSPYKNKTPKSSKTRPAINRIWTAGTPVSGKKSNHSTPQPHWQMQKPRVSSSALGRLVDMGSGVGLPSLGSLSAEGGFGKGGGTEVEADDDDDDEEEEEEEREGGGMWGVVDVDATPRPARKTLPLDVEDRDHEDQEDSLDDDLDDPPSMTLKDILLSADTSQFDLLEFSSEDLGEGLLVEDASFVWE
ncbi:hypothetical protein GALMADRAFT_144407 [Galerina marginata CBS 339.88]|uniref:HAUS augmin-like complex subunit 6 N-terminal domain-containing protein n=1 Tax=Galerina marginata (strain CBS 339.88) TaxID=685588 RepID=A0A067SJA1_GALM3|nr:hypothetical protein GALMADRAFT_144407 [Galerina marginata CBS 339.88]